MSAESTNSAFPCPLAAVRIEQLWCLAALSSVSDDASARLKAALKPCTYEADQ